ENNFSKKVERFIQGHEVVPVCPEVLGGLPIPREPAEIVDGIVVQKSGNSVDNEFRKGAQTALNIVIDTEVELVILQSRSPSCGVNSIYDGSFTGKLIPGEGVFAKILKEANIRVIDVEDL
ncbi:MAG: DUF523 domain-containing protein, partial [Clostridiales bacterium]|nr:DUF523 domain-containing protein [Clostridiales bacterium]